MAVAVRRSRLLWIALAIAASRGPPAAADFLRGDADRDGRVSVTDAVAQLLALFRPGFTLPCEDAADADDDGALRVADAIGTLRYLFSGEPLPYPSGAMTGPDLTCDSLGCRDDALAPSAIVLSEIHYHPAGDARGEFIELHNRTSVAVDASGHAFTQGITLVIPQGTVIPPDGRLLILKDPGLSIWKGLTTPGVGPYEGTLADGGERVSFFDGDCLVESIKYDDRPPWPVGADGYGSSLERIDSRLPADDAHSWRASLGARPTPGAASSTVGTPPRPLIVHWRIEPEAPRSTDPVRLLVTLDLPLARLKGATLRREWARDRIVPGASIAMPAVAETQESARLEATLPPAASQTLVRMRLEVELADGSTLGLPHEAEPAPFLSYFVEDREVRSLFPVLWLLRPGRTQLLPDQRRVGGVAVREPGSDRALLFDGAQLRPSRNGLKLRFLKGAEYRDDRTVNILPEEGQAIGTLEKAPHFEHFSFQVFRAIGALAPWAEWFRVVDHGSTAQPHTQRLLIQQVNERFLEQNGLDPDGDLYKLDHLSFSKQTNLETGTQAITDLLADLGADGARRRQTVLERLDLDNICLYSVASDFIENADGLTNNLFAYHDLAPGGRWLIVPWDLDLVCRDERFPVEAPLAGTFSGPYLREPDLEGRYRESLRQLTAPEGLLSTERLLPRIRDIEDLMLADLQLQEELLGGQRPARRQQIVGSYAALRTFVTGRVAYLRSALAGAR